MMSIERSDFPQFAATIIIDPGRSFCPSTHSRDQEVISWRGGGGTLFYYYNMTLLAQATLFGSFLKGGHGVDETWWTYWRRLGNVIQKVGKNNYLKKKIKILKNQNLRTFFSKKFKKSTN